MNEAMIFAVGVSLGIALSLLIEAHAVGNGHVGRRSHQYDDEDTDLVDDDDEGEAWKRSLN